MSNIKGLRTLVRLKTRRVEQREEAVQASKIQLHEATGSCAAAQAQEAEVREAERAVDERLESTTGNAAGFDSNDVVTLQLLLKEAQQRSAEAAMQSQRAAEQVEQARQHVVDCGRELQRIQRQLEGTQQRLQNALLAQEREQEDSQDEEAEETAVARMLARRRALERRHQHSPQA